MVELLGESPGDVLEIGPGPGGLTLTLLEAGYRVWSIELDTRWARFLQETWAPQFAQHLTVIEGDALLLDWGSILGHLRRVDIVGNLPYYITAPLLAKLMDTTLVWHRAVVMVQQEVAHRLVTEPGHRLANALGVMLRYNMDIHGGFGVTREHFHPIPEIDSAVVKLTRRDPLPVDREAFSWVVHAGFGHRRKMLRQALSQASGSPYSAREWEARMMTAGLRPTARAEALTIEEWVELARLLQMR